MIFEQLPESYAKALLELTQGNEKETLEYLNNIQKILEENKEIKNFFFNPAIPGNLKIEVIKKVFQKSLNEILLNFLCVLTKNSRLEFLPSIIEIYQSYYDEKNNILPVKVTTAIALDANSKKMIETTLERYFQKKLDILFIVKSEILGGIIVQAVGKEIDVSIASQLKTLYFNLKKSVITGDLYED